MNRVIGWPDQFIQHVLKEVNATQTDSLIHNACSNGPLSNSFPNQQGFTAILLFEFSAQLLKGDFRTLSNCAYRAVPWTFFMMLRHIMISLIHE